MDLKFVALVLSSCIQYLHYTFNTLSDNVFIQDSAISTTSTLKEYIHLTWEIPGGGIPTKFWYISHIRFNASCSYRPCYKLSSNC